MSRVHPLIHRFLEDSASLDEADLEALVAYLREHPERAVELREQLLLDDYLSQKLAIDRQNFFAQIEQRIADFERGQEEMYDHVAELRAIAEGEIDKPLRQASRGAWLKYSLATAVALSLVAAIALWQWSPMSPKAVALVEEVSGEITIVRGGQPIAPQLGKAILTGDQVISTAGSTIRWQYKDDTTVRLVGDAAGLVSAAGSTGAKQVKLDRGELVATVARQVRGPMVFATPHATATVRGTQLRLVVGQADTQLDVAEGRVELTRLADGKMIQVAANETAVASADRIALRMPPWPVDRSRAIYLYQGAPQSVLCRNPDTGNFRESELTVVSDGGGLTSTGDGADLTTLWRRAGEFSVEVASVLPGPKEGDGILLSLGSSNDLYLVLQQDGDQLLALVKGSDGDLIELELGPVETKQSVHVLLTGGNGRLATYINGVLVAEKTDVLVDTATWNSGPIVLGADADGRRFWRGVFQRMALFAHFMDAEEAKREWERFKLAHP